MITEVYIDQDGVIADFCSNLNQVHNLPDPYLNPEHHGKWSVWELLGMTEEDMFTPCELEFWSNLPVMSDAHFFIQTVANAFPNANTQILTSPSRNVGCKPGKTAWIEKHFPQFIGKVIFEKEKFKYAHSGSLLIDDNDKNIDKFQAAGGNVIQIPRVWNRMHRVHKEVLSVFNEGIKALLHEKGMLNENLHRQTV